MTNFELTIPGKLASLNATLSSTYKSGRGGNTAYQKKAQQQIIKAAIKAQYGDQFAMLPRSAYYVNLAWFEGNTARDVDNVFSGKKFIMDAFQDKSLQVISNDNRKNVMGYSDLIFYDKEEPRIEVFMTDTEFIRDVDNRTLYRLVKAVKKLRRAQKVIENREIHAITYEYAKHFCGELEAAVDAILDSIEYTNKEQFKAF